MSTDLSDEVYAEIVTARIKFLLEKPFIGTIATHLLAVEAPWCRTAATDGKHLYYNREFVKGLSRPCLMFLIAHEVLHVVFDHMGRRGSRDKDLWNMACLGWGTSILMADGTVQPIQRVLPGDLVASPFGPSRVLGNMFSGIKHTVELGIGSKRIRSTLDHKYAVNTGDFIDAASIIETPCDGYFLGHVGSEGIRPGESRYFVPHGPVGAEWSGVQQRRGFSGRERARGEQVFAQAVQLAAASIALATGAFVPGRHHRWGGNDFVRQALEVSSPHNRCDEHFLATEGLAGGPRFLVFGEEEQSRQALFLSSHVGLGHRSGFGEIAAVSRDQAAARAALAACYRDSEGAAVSWGASGGSIGTAGGNFRIERARFSLEKGSGEPCPAFDLITEAGSFFANGILTHNCDYNINYNLVTYKIGSMPKDGLYDPQFTDEMSVDEIYDILKKNSVTIKAPLDDHLEPSEEGDDDDEGSDGEGEGDEDGEGSGKPSSKGRKGQKEAQVTIVGKNGPPKISKEDMEKIRNDLKATIIQAAQQHGAGNLPAGIKRMLAELTEPKLDWRSMLDAHVRSALKDDYTFGRISRRTWGAGGAILPAQSFMERVELVCAIDASGSTTEAMVTDFMSEIKGIMGTFRDYRILVFSYDTEVYNAHWFTPDNADDVYRYEVKGYGGTAFECIYEYLKRDGIEPHRLVNFTDGMPNAGWGEENFADTLFVIHSNPKITAPFGTTVHYEDARK